MRTAERIRRQETTIERMASQNGRDLRELAKARGRIEELEACLAARPVTYSLALPPGFQVTVSAYGNNWEEVKRTKGAP